MSFHEPQGHVAADKLLGRIEAELGTCRAILAGVESVVETLLKSGNVAADDPLHIVEMQNIDLLDQLLADMMLCLADLAGTDPIKAAPTIRLSQVIRRTRLAALRNRLSGFAVPVDPDDAVELF